MDQTVCANCQSAFPVKQKGYLKYALERKLPRCDVTAKEALAKLTSSEFTPVKEKRKGNCLCPTCWSSLTTTFLYEESNNRFFKQTVQAGYIGKKLQTRQSDANPQPSTSTPSREATSPGARKTLFNFSSVKQKRPPKLASVIGYLRRYQYRSAIKGLYNASAKSRKHFLAFTKNLIRSEVRTILRSDLALCKTPTIEKVEKFSWKEIFEGLDEIAPVISSCLTSVVTTSRNKTSLSRGNTRKVNLQPYVGNALACLLYARNPRKSCLMQTVVSIQFWQGGLKRETIDQLSHIGVCLGYKGTLSAIDKLRKGYDLAAKTCKADLESQLSLPLEPPTVDLEMEKEISDLLSSFINIESESVAISDGYDSNIDDDGPNSSSEDSDDEEETADEEGYSDSSESEGVNEFEPKFEASRVETEMEIETQSDSETSTVNTELVTTNNVLHPGFTLCWDNVGKKVTSRHPSAERGNMYVNVALAFMTMNRVPSTHLDFTAANVIPAVEISTHAFIPEAGDFKEIRKRMEVVVGRIITRHIKWLQDNFSDCVGIHEHLSESAQRSALVNLGVFEENPSSTQGAIAIYERLNEYVPNIDSKPYPTVVFGDGLICERGNDAAKARVNGLNPWERLEGLEPAAQEFHKEMILLQDHYDEFFKGSTAVEKGTLFHLKNLCNYRNVKGDIGGNVSQAWELVCTITESYIILLAMRELHIPSLDDTPTIDVNVENSPKEKRKEYLEQLCKKIVTSVWHDMDTHQSKEELGSEKSGLCCNDDEKEETMIGCESRHRCIGGEWFHPHCVKMDPQNLPDVWYCSADCRKENSTKYCYCKQLIQGEPLIGCSAADTCTGKEWYHYGCVGLTKDTVPEGDWYCSQACRDKRKTKGKAKRQKTEPFDRRKDHKFLYSMALTWSGLNLLVRRDAVREADGDAMMSHWLIDLVSFFKNRHVKYVILAHRLIASINGCVSEKIRQDLRWNRTVNYSGGIGRNLPADLTNEFLNRMFKSLLEDVHGHYTSETLARCSQLIGPFGEALDVIFDANIVEKELYRHRRRTVNRHPQIRRVVDALYSENLVTIVPGRQHRSFAEYEHTENPKFPGKYIDKIRQLSKKLDLKRKVVLDEN